MASFLTSGFCLLAVLVLGQCAQVKKPFVSCAGVMYNSRSYTSMITVKNGEKFGNWTWPEMCPPDYFAVGFSLRVESKQFAADDTALNGIRLICTKNSDRNSIYSVESHTGYYGDWTTTQYCPTGHLVSFQLRVEPHKGIFGDDTAANNIRFRCSSNPTLEGHGRDWGEYGHWSDTCVDGGICGIETKMEEHQGGLDDSTLNDVRFHCCKSTAQA
ncbi:hypothetical protein AALO_G00182560 [Alosa alosa]|uniref:Vitelline membrane outer layer protein 1 homolog n=1 Tax=Alosa alosa TaxID=278164 RepID=A0AAV6GFS6_9TELE|nr:vitelline membrane outer layer protein 1-like [Alosa alosa]KAG5271661.1 hypothetical protein AALO_G00182560 [Alosa alosa]